MVHIKDMFKKLKKAKHVDKQRYRRVIQWLPICNSYIFSYMESPFLDYHGTFHLDFVTLKYVDWGVKEQCSFSWKCKKGFIHVNKRNRFQIEVGVYSFDIKTVLNLLLKVAKCTYRDSFQDIY